MAKTRTGASTILASTRRICRMVGLYGTQGITAATTPEFGAAVAALVVACQAFEALDNYPGEIDQVAPQGPEDQAPAEG